MNVTEHNGFKLGDLITTYHTGFWRLTDIERRWHQVGAILGGKDVGGQEHGALFTYAKEYDADFEPIKRKGWQEECDESHCRKVDADWAADEIDKLERRIEQINGFIATIGN